MSDLTQTNVMYLHGVGPQRAKLLKSELQIESYHDLLYNFPFRYIDRSTIHHIADLHGDNLPSVQLKGHFISFTTQGEGRRRRLTGLFTDGTGTIECVWFHSVNALKNAYNTQTEYIIFGKPTIFRRSYSITHPEIDVYKPEQRHDTLVGVYNLTEKLRNHGFSSRVMQKLVSTLLETPAVKNIADPLPEVFKIRHRLMPLGDALVNVHKPTSMQKMQAAQLRLKYEELFFLELHILKNLKGQNKKLPGLVFSHVGEYFNDFYAHHMQFPLTGAQKRVIKEIRADLGSGRQMNRLLQGDVGSGKTIVAFMTMLIALDNGYQACIMAPTEILATQHYESISEMAQGIGVEVALLTGSTRKKERDRIHAGLHDGSIQILIGTHALLEDPVQFGNLGLAIIDEQHRFGVAQRARLWKKNTIAPPHVLVMTATPIPRTLSMTVYGDLDVSIIDEMPPGRKPVSTYLRYEDKREDVYHFIGGELRKGRQAYIVYPLIKENEKLDLKALEEGFENVKDTFPSYSVAMVHGQMKPAEKDHQMQLFASGKAQILVATTVIEVGVNVPNASIMVIENAERFGLSQLHQLRGRVGRGADQSYCVLMSKHQLAKDTRHRLEVMTQTSDGFVVAEEDMKLRGPGDLEGTQQSGIAFNLKISNLVTDGPIIEMARKDAIEVLERDPELQSDEGRRLARHLQGLYGRTINWSLIS